MYAEPQAVANVLGLKSLRMTTPLKLVQTITAGLPVTALEHLAAVVAPGDAEFKNHFVPKATLSRRKQAHEARLTAEESDRLARIAKIWTHAVDVWKDENDARWFLFEPHQLLDGEKPIDVALSSEIGADLVDQLLGRLEYGSAA